MKLKTLYLTIIAFAAACGTSLAQVTDGAESVVRLKNGTTFSGTVSRSADGLSVSNEAGDVLIVSQTDVASVTPVAADPLKGTPARGYRAFIDANYFIGRALYVAETGTWGAFGVSSTHGFQFNHRFFFGAGAGIAYQRGSRFISEGYKHGNGKLIDDAVIIPFYIAFRTDFNGRKLMPFVDCRVGGFSGDYHGCIYDASFGLRFNRFNASIGYLGLAGGIELPNYDTDDSLSHNTFLFRLGVDFGKRN